MYDQIAVELRQQAIKLQPHIEKKLHPATENQNPTRRRQAIIASMHENAYHMQKVQTILNKIADFRESGKIPWALRLITKRTQVDTLLRYDTLYESIAEGMNDIGVYDQTTYARTRDEVRCLVDDRIYEEARRKRELFAKATELIGQVPGYFPTPLEVVRKMLSLAGDINGEVYDPSCGSGSILQAIKELRPDVIVRGNEVNHTLAEICKEKGLDVTQGDCFNPPHTAHQTIFANPPFENDQDCEHALFYFDHLLSPGGVMVIIVGAGAFFHKTQIAENFRQLVAKYGYTEELPEKSFSASKTNVNTSVVLLHKPVVFLFCPHVRPTQSQA